jgi:serine/threonine protein phosphatase PrpC
MAKLSWGSATHAGQIRPQNEDNLLAVDGIYVVADGMGGHEAGEVASQIAVDRVQADLDMEELPGASTVVNSISNANGDIFRAAIANPGQAGMGTTLTAIAVIGDRLAGRGAPNLDVNDDPGEVTPVVPAEPQVLPLVLAVLCWVNLKYF